MQCDHKYTYTYIYYDTSLVPSPARAHVLCPAPSPRVPSPVPCRARRAGPCPCTQENTSAWDLPTAASIGRLLTTTSFICRSRPSPHLIEGLHVLEGS